MSINIEKDAYKCWVCDESGKKISKLVRRFGNQDQTSAWIELSGDVNISDFSAIMREEEAQKKEATSISLPPEFVSLVGLDDADAPRPMAYLRERGIVREDIIKWKIGYCKTGEYAKRIIIPSFDSKGQLNYFIARLYESGWNKYKNPPTSRDVVFNELNIDWNQEVVLVEGVFDAIKANNAIPALGSTLREASTLFTKIITNCKTVFIALDADAEKKSEKIIDSFLQYGIEVYRIPTGSYSDVGEMTKNQFKQQKSLASFIEREDYLLYKALTL